MATTRRQLSFSIPFLVLAVCLSFSLSVSAQTDDDLMIEELERRAREVTLQYPWLVQNYSGLSMNAYNVHRDELLRGIHAATDLVFEGTEFLNVRISLVGRFPNIEAAIKSICREDLQLDCQIDFSTLSATFIKLPDDTKGLSNVALAERYRQVRMDPNLIRRNYGMNFGGMLIVNGSHFPPPFEFIIEPLLDESRYVFKINGFPVTDFVFTDPRDIDQSLFQAGTIEDLKTSLKNKLDQSWWMTSRFQFAATPEMLSLLSQQAQFLYGVVRSEPMRGGLRLHLSEGSKLDWTLPKGEPAVAFDGPDAYQKATRLQNQIVNGLSVGGVVFVSGRFGNHTLEDPYTFQDDLQRILSGEEDLRSKEKEIRIHWEEEADWVLEYFYTSLVPDTWMLQPPPPSELIPNTDTLGPVFESVEKPMEAAPPPTNESFEEEVTLPAELLPLEIPSRGRALVSPPESEKVEESEFDFEDERGGHGDQIDSEP